MSTPCDTVNHQLWRVGRFGVDATRRRWMFSETWLYTGGGGPTGIPSIPTATWQRWSDPFLTGSAATNFTNAGLWASRIYGGPRTQIKSHLLSATFGPALNPAAPEAALRLQRVGATSSGEQIGRLAVPILNDGWFTDQPHRRHVAAVDLQTLLNAHLAGGAWPMTLGGGLWTNVIFHRGRMTTTPVTNYRVMRSTVRCWQRWRLYPQVGHVVAHDQIWKPPSQI